jgi:Tol biopolymer transport system component
VVSPDGSKIAFVRGSFEEIWIMGSDGTDARRVGAPPAPDDFRGSIAWSPRGDRIAYLRSAPQTSSHSPKVRYAIETLAVDGEAPTIVARSEHYLWGLCWAPDGRLLYSSDDDSAHEMGDSGIWAIRVNEKTGEKLAEPVQVSKGTGYVGGLSLTADGKRLVLWRDNVHPTVFVSEIDSRTGDFKTPRRLTLDQNSNYATTWTPDSRAVVFGSNRNGTFKLFRQVIDQAVAEVLVEARSSFQPRLSPDGTEILFLAGYLQPDPTQPVRLMAVPVGGGAPRDILQLPRIADIQCARSPSQLCLLATYSPPREYSFDPKDGKMQPFPLLQGISWTHWGLSPDGSQVALASVSGAQRKITFVRLSDGSRHEVEVGARGIAGMDWAADSKGVYLVTSGANGSSVLAKVSPDGKRQELLNRDRGQWFTYVIPSPDGRYAALTVYTGENNVWMIENF